MCSHMLQTDNTNMHVYKGPPYARIRIHGYPRMRIRIQGPPSYTATPETIIESMNNSSTTRLTLEGLSLL